MFDDVFMSFLGLSGLAPLEERRVALDEFDEWEVSTVSMPDTPGFNYETAVCSPDFNEGNWIIVENYVTIEESKAGHQKWIDLCKGNPTVILDVASSEIAKQCGIEPTYFEKGNTTDE